MATRGAASVLSPSAPRDRVTKYQRRVCIGGRIANRPNIAAISTLHGGVPDLPSPRLRAAAAGRHSPLRLLCAHLIVIWRYFRQVRLPSTLTYTLLLLQPLRKPHAIRRCWVPPEVAQERTHFPGRLHSGCTPVADSGGRSGTPPVIIEMFKLFGLLARRAPTQARHSH